MTHPYAPLGRGAVHILGCQQFQLRDLLAGRSRRRKRTETRSRHSKWWPVHCGLRTLPSAIENPSVPPTQEGVEMLLRVNTPGQIRSMYACGDAHI